MLPDRVAQHCVFEFIVSFNYSNLLIECRLSWCNFYICITNLTNGNLNYNPAIYSY